MKDYQQKKLKAYVLPQPVYRQALWAVKDMQRLKTRLAELKADAYVLGGRDYGMPVSGYGTGCLCDSTGSSAIKIAHVEGRIDAIEQALMAVPSEYRDGIRDKILYDMPYSEKAHINTWKRWQQVFLYHVASNLQIL